MVRRFYLKKLIATAALFTITISAPVRADLKNESVPTRCQSYSSAKEFVIQSHTRCLKQENTRSCEERAREQFKRCGFPGKYGRLKKQAAQEMLVMLVVATATQGKRR